MSSAVWPSPRFVELDTLPPADDIEPCSIVSLSLSSRTAGFTHGLHRFPAKFIPQIPGWAIDQFSASGRSVLDPFAGSGTTNVESLLRGRDSIGLEIDPLARLIARAKSTVIPPARLEELRDQLAAVWVPSKGPARLPLRGVGNVEHWFTREAWRELHGLFAAIDKTPCSDDERQFLLAVFSSVVRWVSNADDQTQKTYVSHTRPKSPPPVRPTFWRALERATSGMRDLVEKVPGRTKSVFPDDGDALRIALRPGSVDLAISSPPYLDSVDYPYNLMLEYFWLGPYLGVPDRDAYNSLRRQPVGAKNPALPESLPSAVRELIDLTQLPLARRQAAATYFAFMAQHFEQMGRVVRPGGRYVMVVGNSQTSTGMLPTHEAVAKLASLHGFSLEHAFGYRIRRHYMKFPRAGRGGIILVDWVLTFRRVTSVEPRHWMLPRTWLTLGPGAVAH